MSGRSSCAEGTTAAAGAAHIMSAGMVDASPGAGSGDSDGGGSTPLRHSGSLESLVLSVPSESAVSVGSAGGGTASRSASSVCTSAADSRGPVATPATGSTTGTSIRTSPLRDHYRRLRVRVPEEEQSLQHIVPVPAGTAASADQLSCSATIQPQAGVWPDDPDADRTLIGSHYAAALRRGHRRHQEDSFLTQPALAGDVKVGLFGVCDGHGATGKQASQFVATELIKQVAADTSFAQDVRCGFERAFRDTEQQCLQSLQSAQSASTGCPRGGTEAVQRVGGGGTTVVSAYISAEHNRVWVANAGDSRCVLSRRGVAVPLSFDHTPDRPDERARIEASGGHIVDMGTLRVEGSLAVTRSIGDFRLKRFVCSVPEVCSEPLTGREEFLILATDGLWKHVSSQQAVDTVMAAASVDAACDALAAQALSSGSRDNISVVVVYLHPYCALLSPEPNEFLQQQHMPLSLEAALQCPTGPTDDFIPIRVPISTSAVNSPVGPHHPHSSSSISGHGELTTLPEPNPNWVATAPKGLPTPHAFRPLLSATSAAGALSMPNSQGSTIGVNNSSCTPRHYSAQLRSPQHLGCEEIVRSPPPLDAAVTLLELPELRRHGASPPLLGVNGFTSRASPPYRFPARSSSGGGSSVGSPVLNLHISSGSANSPPGPLALALSLPSSPNYDSSSMYGAPVFIGAPAISTSVVAPISSRAKQAKSFF